MLTRRNFLRNAGGTGALALLPAVSFAEKMISSGETASLNVNELIVPLTGSWDFRTDPDNKGEQDKWYTGSKGDNGWKSVQVPHTWQTAPETADYFGAAWYKRTFTAPADWKDKTVRIEFEAVYHSASVWLNGVQVGEHVRKGYTAFFIDLSKALKAGAENLLVVKADNHFDDKMLPRNHSYDWAADGGITRPVSLHITEPAFIEHVMVTAVPDLEQGRASVAVKSTLSNNGRKNTSLHIGYRITEEKSGKVVAERAPQKVSLPGGKQQEITLPAATVTEPLLWHFDHPHLYLLEVSLFDGDRLVHGYHTLFGIRKMEVKNAAFYLNGERVRLMGVERMAGSNPEYGMAEAGHWIDHDHRDLKELNCIFTRVHWQQDKRVLDFCDRHGILMQEEVPTWGGATFKGMTGQPSEDIMQNGLEQLREMIRRDHHHPCIISWGLCNEIGGQNPPAYHFAENMLHEAKRLDPYRLCSYASNSLQSTPGKDVSQLMDFVEWNEYYESWYKGTVDDMERNLEEIHRAFPDKPIVISEYGWCRCTADRLEGDPKKIRILQSHDEVFRRHPYVGGLIFFCYNDYRTHIGDKGIGVMKQRVHGVVDLYGARKPSFDVLRQESSPLNDLKATLNGQQLQVSLTTREAVPAYTLRGYRLRWIGYASQDIPLERQEVELPELAPGGSFSHDFTTHLPQFEKIIVDVVRPTGFSADTLQI